MSAWRQVGLYSLIALLAGLYLFPFVRVLSGATDEGLYAYASEEALEGAIPGRDFVQENPPGAYYWLALFFRIFGTHMMTARIVLLLTGVATVLLLIYLARRIGSRGFFAAIFFLITCIPLTPINSPHYDSNFFALLAFAVFLIGADAMVQGRPKRWPFVVAGILTGWVSCLLQQKGFLFLAAFAASMLVLHRKDAIKPCLVMCVSYASVLFAEIVPYLIWGALPDLIFANVTLPLSHYDSVNHVEYGYPLWTVWFPQLFGHLRADFSILVTAPAVTMMSLPFLLLLVVPFLLPVLAYRYRSRIFEKRWIPYWITGYAMWLSELHRQDLSHFRNGSILLVLLFFAVCDRISARPFKYAAVAIALGTVLLGTTDLNGTLYLNHPVTTRRGTMFAKQRDPVLEFLLARTRPGDYAFIYPYSPVYYFLAALRNPTALNVIVDQRANPLIERAISALEAKKPRYAVAYTPLLGDGMRVVFPGFRPPDPKDRVIDRYIDAHYHQVAFENGFRILERNQD
jgi:Dolichyl-phosphate-mannose-protein mannosyltransferase